MNAQQTHALSLAQKIKSERKLIRAYLSENTGTYAGSLHRLAEIIESEQPCVQSMRLSKLLHYCHGLGPYGVQLALLNTSASPERRVGDLTERQRACLVEYLRA